MSNETKINSNKRKIDEEKWNELSREDIIQRCKQLEKHVEQLRNVLNKTDEKEKTNKTMRPFDFNKYSRRHIFLKFIYLGWDYHGLVVQETTTQTVEDYLFEALLKTRLIEQRATSNYNRCGRTDRGVSAFSQVISITVRSKQSANVDCLSSTDELNYVQMLNGVLPSSIRCIAWAPVPDGKSARFDCSSRAYRYYFPRANLDLNRIQQAANDLIGTHDYRSFCKIDITNSEPTFIRRIDRITVEPFDHDDHSRNPGYQMCELLVHGSGFLWHQIRCIVAILLLIGQGKEEISLIKSLLDIEKYPRTPNYQIASELPLVLFDCQFDDINWICDENSLRLTICHLQRHWSSFQIRATMIRSMLNQLENQLTSDEQGIILGQLGLIENDSSSLLSSINNQRKSYQPILTRAVRDSVETKLEKYQNKKAKLGTTNQDDTT